MADVKFSWSSYWKPTPKKIRKIADAISAAAVFAGGITALNGAAIAGTIIFISAFVAKAVSNFFTDESIDNENSK